jgi:hypothetical protein
MGKSATDLTEPLHAVGPVGSVTGGAAAADEIISQMADEQIDRLMAAEGAQPAPEAEVPATAAERATSPAQSESPAAQIMAAAAAVMGSAVAAPEAKPVMAQGEFTSVAQAEPPSPGSAEAAQLMEVSAARDTIVEDLKHAAESVAGRGTVRGAAAAPRMPSQRQSSPPQWVVSMLELLNAPMRGCSEDLRQGIGKIALLTVFNAAAVLIYVLIFRRGHH